MRWILAALVLLLCSGAPAVAQDAPTAAPDVVVRESLDPASGAVIGQRVALLVDVLFRDAMPRPPRVTLPEVAGVQALRFETQGTTMRETIAGEPYVGQRFEFALYARRGGAFEIPPATITLLKPGGDVTGSAQGQAVRFDVLVPPGVDPSAPVVATRELTLSEQWEPDPKRAFKAGGAIVRTITRTAEDVPGLAMRDLTFAAPEGVRAYTDQPEISDRSNRGIVTGRRVDRVTYLFERGGRFALPAVAQPWWDLGGGTLRIADAAGAAIEVSAPAPGQTSSQAESRGLAVAGAGAALLILLAFGPRFLLHRRSADDAESEDEAFAALRRVCSGANPEAIYRAFSLWRPLLPPDEQTAAMKAAAPLDAALFKGGNAGWSIKDSRTFITRLTPLRRSQPASGRTSPLPPLNP